ncbi:MAG: hypothetical protein Kow00124_13950 [Anaerolineae bacterium]
MTSEDRRRERRADRRIALALALFYLAVYLITGFFFTFSIDELATFLLGRNLAMRGALDADLLFWAREPMGSGSVIAPGISGHYYVVKEPGPSFLMVPLIWLAGLLGLNRLHTAFLLSPLITAATAGLLYLVIRRRGYGRQTAVLGTLTFGLASMGWVYSGTLFTQPLAALGLLGAVISAITAYETDDWRAALLCGLLAGLAGTGGMVTLAAGPLYALYVIPWEDARAGVMNLLRRSWRSLLAMLAGALIFVALLAVYNLYRFGSPLESGHSMNNIDAGASPLFSLSYVPVGLVGLLISTPRGLLWHAPFVLLIPFGLAAGWRSPHRRAMLLIVAQVALLILADSVYLAWNGGLAWGPRRMANLMPLMTLLALPALAAALERGGWRRILAYAVLTISFLTQLYTVLSYNHDVLAARADATAEPTEGITPAFFDPAFMPQAEMLGLARDADGVRLGPFTDRTWTVLWMSEGSPDWPVLLAGLVVVLASGVLAARLLRVPHDRRAGPLLAGCSLLVMALAALLLIRYPAVPPDADRGVTALARAVEEAAAPGDAVLGVMPYTYMNWAAAASGRLPEYGMPYAAQLSDATLAMLDRVRGWHDRVWVIADGLYDADPNNGVEQWLLDRAYGGNAAWFESHYRLRPYAFPQGEIALTPSGQSFGESIRLAAAGAQAAPGGVLVHLRWEAAAPVDIDYSIFVHLFDVNGGLIAQQDGQPRAGYAPLTTWQPGVPVDDRRLIVLPESLPPGEYRLFVGMYNWMTGERLRLADGTDTLLIGTVSISGTP